MRRIKFFPIVMLAMLAIFGIRIPFGAAQTVASLEPRDAKLRDTVQYTSFITAKPIPSWGSILGTKDASVHLSEGEIVYIEVESTRDVRAGDRFTILHPAQEVIHPLTKKKMGRLVVVSGEVLILSAKEAMATGRIEKSFRSIREGDLIVPPPKTLPQSISLRSMKRMEGIVLMAMEGSENMTQKELIFIDRGSTHGVIVGDRFSVYQKAHFPAEIIKKKKGQLPMIKVGEVVVVSVQEESATALIVQSSQAIYAGDKVVSGGE